MLKCKTALTAAFQQLARHASLAGWHDAEIALALADLADQHIEATAKELDIRKWQPLRPQKTSEPKIPRSVKRQRFPDSLTAASMTAPADD